MLDYLTSLTQAGLSKDQASIYEALVKNGPLPAGKIPKYAGISRPLVYKVLGELITLGLVEKREESGKVAIFTPEHPLKLKDLIEKKRAEAEDAKKAIDGILSKIASDFNLVSGQPGIRISEGVAGIAELYEDILNEGKEISLIRSVYDEKFPELSSLVAEQIKNQVKFKISARVISPREANYRKGFIENDTKNLVVQRLIPQEKFSTPAQILIYANKVAITSYQEPLITTIIENRAIKETFLSMFEYIWKASEAGHEKIVGEIYSSIE